MKTPRNFKTSDKTEKKREESKESYEPIDNNSTEGDLTEEDFEALGPEDLNMDMGDDEQLKHRAHPVDFSGGDLDVPGAELDDADEEIGSEDEENNSFSLDDDNN
jgi:hypothetical protein